MDKKLTLIASIVVALPTLLLVLTACGVIVEGACAECAVFHYYYQIVTTVSLLLIPLALRLMVMRRVKAKVQTSDEAYFRYSLCRLGLLETVLSLGAAGYVLFMESGMTWCYGVALVAMVFVWPSRKRRMIEQGKEAKDE